MGGVFFDALDIGIGVGIAGFIFSDVGNVDDGLQGQEIEVFNLRQVVFGKACFAGRFAVFKAGENFFQDVVFDLGFFIAALGDFGDAVGSFLHRF